MQSATSYEPARLMSITRALCRSKHTTLAYLAVVLSLLFLLPKSASATLFADVSGVVHDVQHRTLSGATVELKAEGSAFTVKTGSTLDGRFRFTAIPFGEYTLTVTHEGFSAVSRQLAITSDSSPFLHIALPVVTVSEDITVTSDAMADPSSVTPTVLLSQSAIQNTPGADRSILSR